MDFVNTTFDELRGLLRNRYSTKWNRYDSEVIPMWVADMDLGVDESIVSAIDDASRNFGLGYPSQSLMDELNSSFSRLYARKFNGKIDQTLTVATTDVVQTIYIAISTFSEEGDGVIVQTPTYPPFLSTPKILKRNAVENRLKVDDDGYHFDIDDFYAKASDPKNKIALLCSPHNPTGMVMSRELLLEVSKICAETDTLMIVDEIHGQIIFGDTFTSISAIDTDADYIVCTSATKAYNIAGTRCAVAAFSSKGVMDKFDAIPFHLRGMPSNIGVVAAIAAWDHADPWLSRVLDHLNHNRSVLRSFTERSELFTIPKNSRATYLAWLRFVDDSQPWKVLLDKAKVGCSPGIDFGESGNYHARMNLATTTATLEEALNRIEKYL